jgi:hypothetical protein
MPRLGTPPKGLEPARVRIEQHLVRLAVVRHQQEGPAGCQLGVRHLQAPAQAAYKGVLATPVELERLAQLETQRHAEVYSWSWSGRFLVMERLDPITLQDLAGHETPQFVNDKKPSNFGKNKAGRIKALDYATLDLSPHPLHHFPASFDKIVA